MWTFDKFFSEAEEHHLKLVEILPEDEQLNHQEEREYIDSQVFEMKRIACVWLTQNEPSPSQRSSRASSRSGSRRASSKSSSHSSKHSSSRHSEKSKSSSQIEDLKREEKGLQKLLFLYQANIVHLQEKKVHLFSRLLKRKLIFYQ